MILAIASGKGGTGKTTLALSLARVRGAGALLLDCDVEEPNTLLFLNGAEVEERPVRIPIPEVDASRCDSCGQCANLCQYGAILAMPRGALVYPELCHACGGCARVCPKGAIREIDWTVGVLEESQADGVRVVQGRMQVGMSMAPPVIRAVRREERHGELVIIDAPPGTSCAAGAAIQGADYVLLAAEPTRFGLHDLKLAVEMVRHFGIPFGVVVNRAGMGDDGVERFCHEESIPLLLSIPEDRKVAEAYSRGRLPVDEVPGYRERIEELLERIPGV